MIQARRICQAPVILTVLAVVVSSSITSKSNQADQGTPPDTTQSQRGDRFSSTQGGLTLDIPKGWHATEFPGEKLYRCTLSANPVLKAQDPINLGALIERTSDYTKAFGWKKADPTTLAISHIIEIGTRDSVSRGKSCVVTFAPANPTPEQIQQSIAEARAKTPDGAKGLPAVVLIPSEPSKSLAGMKSFQYDVFTNYEGDFCTYHHVLIAVVKKQWLALDFLTTDCTRYDLVQPLFKDTVASLEVNQKWPK